MRRPLTLLVAALLVLTAIPASSSQTEPPGTLSQQESGAILLPTRFPLGNAERDGWPGLARRVWLCSADSNGSIAHIIDVFPGTWGGGFIVDSVADATGSGEVDVYFYSDFGDCGGSAAPVTTGEFASDGDREIGVVPAGSTKAVVFTHNGVDTTFRYRAWSAPEIALSGELDLTVLRGNTVTWLNDTEDYESVRHVPTSGSVLFDSSPKPNSGIPVDGSFSYTFGRAGTYDYETATGRTGTITVIDSLE